MSLPAMESLKAEYTEVWCAEQNVPLARFADRAVSIGSAGLDRAGLLNDADVRERLKGFDEIVSWYGSSNEDFRSAVAAYPFRFFPALPDGTCHAVDYYNRQVGADGWPVIRVPRVTRTYAVIHPFASSPAKRGPMALFEKIAKQLGERMPVHWLSGPEEDLPGAIQIPNLYDLAQWLAGARVFVGNDSGITHLAAAVGTPAMALFFRGSPKVWNPKGSPASYWIKL